jgi:hypothetical protein
MMQDQNTKNQKNYNHEAHEERQAQIPNKTKLVSHRKDAKYAKDIQCRFSLRSLRLCGELSVVFFHSFQKLGVDIRNAVEHTVP